MSQPISNMLYPIANGITSSNPFIEIFQTRAPTANDVNYPIQKRWYDKTGHVEYLLANYITTPTIYGPQLTANWVSAAPGNPLLSYLQGVNAVGLFPVIPNVLGQITLSSIDGSVTITGGLNSLDFASTGGGGGGAGTITGDSGGALSQIANNWNIFGSGSITTAGGGATLTVELQNLTQYNLLVGNGTTTIFKIPPVATLGIPLISMGAGAFPDYGTAVVAGGGTGSTSFNVNGVVISGTGATSPLTALTLTDGQVVIGSTGLAPVAGTITGLGSITVATGPGTITISDAGGGFSWHDVTTATQALAVSNGYITDRGAGVTYTLPVNASIGDTIKIVGKLGLTTVSVNAGQQILMASAATTVTTGQLIGTDVGDCLELICITGNTTWRVATSIGNITYT